MALSTTQSIWRSGGGDQTRTAYCGSGVMAASFYIADASPAVAGTNVTVSNGGPALILPAGAVVLSVSINDGGTGTFDLGATGYTSGTADNNYIASGVSALVGTTSVGSVVTGTPLTEMSYVTVTDNTSGAGTVGGYITYFVVDPLLGQQNV
ncbi:hypothetical protein EBT31_10555 [bacterium]|jgi:hypothetical protein|nr:hypothetical protein [bacterium]